MRPNLTASYGKESDTVTYIADSSMRACESLQIDDSSINGRSIAYVTLLPDAI